MAERGANVIMACRDVEQGQIERTMIVTKTRNTNVKVMHLDLASFKSIRTFAETFLKEESTLDILINNESVMASEARRTEDGLEWTMGVNHFGHFLLTILLLDRMRKSSPSRIVTLGHWGHTFVRFNKSSVYSGKSSNRFHAYFHSKLANVLFTAELGNRLKNSGVTATCLHPGIFHDSSSHHTGSLMYLLCWY